VPASLLEGIDIIITITIIIIIIIIITTIMYKGKRTGGIK